MTKTTKPAFTPEEANRIARERGYRGYDHMIYVMKNGLPQPKAKPQQTNFLQTLWNDPKKALKDVFSWHPSNTLGRTNEAIERARER